MEHLGPKIKRIDQLCKIRMNKNLEQLDITVAQMHVLLHLFHCKGDKITQKMLSEHLEVKHSTMSGILNRLKEKELIEINVDNENKKYKNITLTEKALEKIEFMSCQRNETEAILLNGFSQNEIEQLYGYFERLYNNLVNGTEVSEEDMNCFNKKLERRHDD